jgi:hypothetical protein
MVEVAPIETLGSATRQLFRQKSYSSPHHKQVKLKSLLLSNLEAKRDFRETLNLKRRCACI